MVGKPVKTNATNSSGKTDSKKRRVVSALTVDDTDVPVDSSSSAVESPTEQPSVAEPASDSSIPSTEPDTKQKPSVDVSTLICQLKEEVTASIAAMKLVNAKVRELEKAYNKEKRAKGSRKRKSPETETPIEPKPEKQFEIQDPLREFLGTAVGEKVGKKSARKALSVYIKEHELHDPEDHTRIKPDEKLLNLFGPPRYVTTKGQKGYSHLNVIRYIQDYFIKPVEDVVQGPSPPPEGTVVEASA